MQEYSVIVIQLEAIYELFTHNPLEVIAVIVMKTQIMDSLPVRLCIFCILMLGSLSVSGKYEGILDF